MTLFCIKSFANSTLPERVHLCSCIWHLSPSPHLLLHSHLHHTHSGSTSHQSLDISGLLTASYLCTCYNRTEVNFSTFSCGEFLLSFQVSTLSMKPTPGGSSLLCAPLQSTWFVPPFCVSTPMFHGRSLKSVTRSMQLYVLDVGYRTWNTVTFFKCRNK